MAVNCRGGPFLKLKEKSYHFNSFNPHVHKMGPRRSKHYIFGDHFYSKNSRKLRLHLFLHFNAKNNTISSFYLKWIEFRRSCEFVPI